VFALLAQAGWIDAALADALKRMVGFRNIAVHDYQTLQLPITVNIIIKRLDEFLNYSAAILRNDAGKCKIRRYLRLNGSVLAVSTLTGYSTDPAVYTNLSGSQPRCTQSRNDQWGMDSVL
jgi:hypothetical protein